MQAQPGKIQRGQRAQNCQNHLHQLHACLPSRPGHTRLLYRMSMDFMGWARMVPGIQRFWQHIAGQVSAAHCLMGLQAQHPIWQGVAIWTDTAPWLYCCTCSGHLMRKLAACLDSS